MLLIERGAWPGYTPVWRLCLALVLTLTRHCLPFIPSDLGWSWHYVWWLRSLSLGPGSQSEQEAMRWEKPDCIPNADAAVL